MKLFSPLLCFTLVFATVFTTAGFKAVSAEVPYDSYNYSYWEKAVPSAVPYKPQAIIDGRAEAYGAFQSPEDLFVTKDNDIYILDSGNNRIVVLDEAFQLRKVIDGFQNGGAADTFNNPQGIFVTGEGSIYVADTDNQRVVELTNEGELIRIINRPESDVIRAGFEYYPTKIAVDQAKRIYVVSRGVYDGIIEFDSDGVFTGFTGANKVTFNPVDYLWRVLATREQRARMSLFIPIEFNNVDVDADGFLYTTNSELNTQTPIQRLNPTGTDVIRKEGYHDIVGDLVYPHTGENAGGSTFIDISVNEYGMYSALDAKRGRIFTYDEDGNLLYIFGQLGNQTGTFRTPVAIDRLEDNILVLDKGFHRLTVFRPTEFGRLVNQAVMHYNIGNDAISAEYWEKVLRLNANYDIAYIGIGKALLMEGKNEEAMEYFLNGHSRKYYSKAYKRYRQEVMRENFGTIMGALLLFPALIIGWKAAGAVRRRRGKAVVE
ncbi:NHL repeat-containing protein [Evansella caseinilytica]|uniref:NHL repeat-containing protein n=1 Tax=Evansella caseinilytica TaxID=1503961 RepID=A0A1H3P2I0_9BACI|nr:NHL repeat-containing protein [Evansella caseinilytica]SDY95288.1 NHL repeat-containing protein [Evansella caseinilytica]